MTEKPDDLKVTRRKLSEYAPDKRNANKGTVRGASLHEESMSQLGAGRSILSDANGNIIAGNKTLEHAVDIGIENVIEVETDGKTLVVVKRKDMDLTDPAGSARLMAYYDNRVAQVGLEWDPAMLLSDAGAGVPLDKLFDDDEFKALTELTRTQQGEDAGGAGGGDSAELLNRAQRLITHYGVGPGVLYKVGRHRVMCGNAYEDADLQRLLAGAVPNLANLDPPYGINVVKADPVDGEAGHGATSGTHRKSTTGMMGKTARRAKTGGDMDETPQGSKIVQSTTYPVMIGDDRPFTPGRFLSMASVVILWGANYYADQLPPSSAWICWDKRESLTRNSFADCELAWTNSGGPARVFYHLWNGLHKGSEHGDDRLHPTQKPVDLYAEIGLKYAPSGVWLDTFLGSGSQLIAAERVGATLYGLELEAAYVALSLERFEKYGLSVERIAE